MGRIFSTHPVAPRLRRFHVQLLLAGFVVGALVFGCASLRQCAAPSPKPEILGANLPLVEGEALVLLGQCAMPANPRDILLFDDIAAVALKREGLCWVDVSDPERPELIARRWTPCPIDMARVGERVFMATQDGGISVWDFSEPLNPTELSTLDTPDRAVGLAVRAPYVYVACAGRGLLTAQWGQSDRLTSVSLYEDVEYARSVALLDDEYALVSDSLGGAVDVLRLRGKTAPRFVSQARVPDKFIDHVTLVGKIAYASTRVQVTVIDYTRPGAPKLLGALWRDSNGKVMETALRGACLFVLRESEGIDLYDVSRPKSPRFVGHSAAAKDANALAFKDDVVYATCWDQRLIVLRAHPVVARLMARR